MAQLLSSRIAPRIAAVLSLAALLASSAAFAGPVFDTPAPFTGTVRFSGEKGTPAYSGAPVTAEGRGFAPQQEITVLRGQTRLSPEGLKADDKGGFSFSFDLPAEAATGLQPIVVQTTKPDSADVIELQISPKIPFSGAERYDITASKVAPGLYQVGYSAKNDALFVTSAAGRPPKIASKLLKLDPKSLKVIAEATPADAPAEGERPALPYAVYGIAVDDANDTIWVSNTRQDTVAVYAQKDLSLVKQFPAGTVLHARDVVIDPVHGRAYASAAMGNQVMVFDTKTLEPLAPISIASKVRGERFTVLSLTLDAASNRLYAVSLSTPEVARIDLATGAAEILSVPGAVRASGIAYDPKADRIFVASQGSDDLVGLDGKTGTVAFDTPVGAQALNALFDPLTGHAYVMNRGSDSIAVVDGASGALVANLDAGSFPNHGIVTADGTVYAVNKARGQDDSEGDQIWRIVPKK
ncbi:hypothetical protein [Paenirhodobacter sp.]|uniref:hypothetical protein n=1 Tax=Paenirhodobacter sp. TaxID=1965326 RepID=UPI003B50E526